MSDRFASYKNAGRNSELSRRSRIDHSVEIRKVKRVDQQEKRRNIVLEDLSDASPLKDDVQKAAPLSVKAVCKQMRHKDESKRLEAVIACRKALSREKNPPIEQYYKDGAVKTLVKVLNNPGTQMESQMIFEAAWALTNIASGESRHTAAVVEQGGIEIFLRLMDHQENNISEQSVWALANIAGDCADFRDAMLKADVVTIVKNAVIRFWSNMSAMKQLMWLISNLCRHKTDTIQGILDLLPIIYEVMSKQNDTEIHVDLTWALSYATDSNEKIIDSVIEHNFLPLINFNLGRTDNVVIPSIRLMGNIIAGTDAQASSAIEAGAILPMSKLLSSGTARIVKETCWLLSNISAGTEDQVMTLLNSGVIPSILNILENGDYKSQKEAVWVISNMITCKKDEPKCYLLNNNIFKYLIPLLSCDDAKVVMLLLESIKSLLALSEVYNELEQCINLFEAAGGIDVIEELQNHSSDEVYNLSYELVKEYFGAEDDEEEDAETMQQFNF